MSYTFGAGTADDITAAGIVQAGADNGATLVAGWFFPTTLTATRGYWSCSSTFGAEVDATTSEIRMKTFNATTNGEWLTSGAGITVDKWWFVAWLNAAENTTVTGDWRVWVGDADSPPAEISVSNPTPRSGIYLGSTSRTIGNKGTGTLAFQGDIGWMSFVVGAFTTFPTNPFNLAASGVIDQAEADLNYQRWVVPLWKGEPDYYNNRGGSGYEVSHYPLDSPTEPLVYRDSSSATIGPAVLDVNGATFTEHAPPRRPPHNWPNLAPFVRR